MFLNICGISLLLWVGAIYCQDDEVCGRPADIAFIIDSSRSIRKDDFDIQIKFIKTLVSKFDISEDKTQIAALQFAQTADIEFYFNKTYTKHDVINKISMINQSNGGYTYTHLALKALREKLFDPNMGTRAGVPKICILLSDGASTIRSKTFPEAEAVKEAGIILLAIGVGRVNIKELQTIVSPPYQKNFFYIRNFDKMEDANFQTIVGSQACAVTETVPVTDAPITLQPPTTTPEPTTQKPTTPKPTTPKPTTPKPTTPKPTTVAPESTTDMIDTEPDKTCQGKAADVVFVLDKSSSIWEEDFKRQLAFVNDVISHFDVDGGKTKVGAITFSDNASVVFDLNAFSNRKDMSGAISSINHDGGITNTHEAFSIAANYMFTQKGGARANVAHILILITDGRSSKPELTREAAQMLHDNGVYLFAVGVGNMTDTTELAQLASKPTKEYMYEVNGYKALKSIKHILAYKTCEVPQGDGSKCAKDIQADMMFGLVDVGGEYRSQVTKFIKSVGIGFDMASGNVRIGMMENCGRANLHFTEFEDNEEFQSKISETMTTNVASYVMSMRKMYSKLGSNDRNRLVVLFVTGEIPDFDSVMNEIRRMKSNTRIVVIGIGNGYSEEQLVMMASWTTGYKPDDSHVLSVQDASELPFIVKKLHVLLCKEQK